MSLKKFLCIFAFIIGLNASAVEQTEQKKHETYGPEWAGKTATTLILFPITELELTESKNSYYHGALLVAFSFFTWPITLPLTIVATPLAYLIGSQYPKDQSSDNS